MGIHDFLVCILSLYLIVHPVHVVDLLASRGGGHHTASDRRFPDGNDLLASLSEDFIQVYIKTN